MCINVHIKRRVVVSISGRFNDEAVPEIKHRLERLGRTKVENYDVFPATPKLDAVVNVRLETDASDRELLEAVKTIQNVNSVRAEEIDARPQ